MQNMHRICRLIFVVVAVLLMCVSMACANITPSYISTLPEGTDFRWVYDVTVDADQNVEAGDFFTIYDFDGFISGSNLQPAGWSFSSSGLGVTPTLVLPSDDPSSPNLTWTRTGGTIVGPFDLGLFSAVSAYTDPKMDNFTGRGTRNFGFSAGTKISNIGEIATPSGTPEPASMAILGLGCLPFIKRFRKKSK